MPEWLLSKGLQIANVDKDIEKKDPCILLTGMLSGAATMENSTENPQKTKYRTRVWPRNFIPQCIFGKKKKEEILIQKDACTPPHS